MQAQNENDSFSYTYSAKEQEELKQIRQKYQPKEESKMDRLRRLDSGITQKATMYALIIGIMGALIMGAGMSLTMTNFGESIGLTGTIGMIVGIIVGIIGIILVFFAYPVYNWIIKKEREKIAPEILRLTEELMKE